MLLTAESIFHYLSNRIILSFILITQTCPFGDDMTLVTLSSGFKSIRKTLSEAISPTILIVGYFFLVFLSNGHRFTDQQELLQIISKYFIYYLDKIKEELCVSLLISVTDKFLLCFKCFTF